MFSRKHHATAAPRLGSKVSPTRLLAVHTPTVQRLADEQPNQRDRRRDCSAAIACSMCNLYSQTKGQQAIIALTKSMRDSVGNLPPLPGIFRSEEHTSELQSLMRISYAVFCLKNKTQQHYEPDRKNTIHNHHHYRSSRH